MNTGFIEHPNLPENKVRLFAVQNIPEIKKAVENLGAECISLENPVLPDELMGHSDMLLCHTGKKRIFIDVNQKEAAEKLIEEGFLLSFCDSIKSSYPDDVKLNAAVGRDCFIGCRKTADTALFSELINSGRKFISVNQGYTKCSTCFIAPGAVITDDEAEAAVLHRQNFDVLLVSKGDIYLSSKHYGFFGGASGKTDKNTLAITGELRYHRDCDKIYSFLSEHSIDIIELTDGPITDIGGILPLKEDI